MAGAVPLRSSEIRYQATSKNQNLGHDVCLCLFVWHGEALLSSAICHIQAISKVATRVRTVGCQLQADSVCKTPAGGGPLSLCMSMQSLSGLFQEFIPSIIKAVTKFMVLDSQLHGLVGRTPACQGLILSARSALHSCLSSSHCGCYMSPSCLTMYAVVRLCNNKDHGEGAAGCVKV